jgi:hypothetical protein
MASISNAPSLLARHGLHFALLFAVLVTSLLVLQQQRTIDTQRVLIRDLFHDSLELTQIKLSAAGHGRR